MEINIEIDKHFSFRVEVLHTVPTESLKTELHKLFSSML